ncbi:FecR family protein [Sphingobacterium sp. SGG-5]|uniref:FecR family protein n=1 Tax=Sphingobacterium sp. SGG-5 TaxID=2710881 RepID=UPI0013EAEF93|nr:FecR family protein [Sphingobacterium sp. SGG-5]NGM63161.1 FecR family protein [Sphingobacterium sp. SGG-5]
MDDRYYIELLERFRLGLATKEETDQLKAWITHPEAKEICYSHFQKKWEEASPVMNTQQQVSMLTQIMDKIGANEEPIRDISTKRSPRIRWGSYTAAASIILLIGIGVFFWVKNYRHAMLGKGIVTIAADNGQKSHVMLADGTRVYINSDSRISYDESYNKKERTIILEGEAYFEVAKDAKKAFVVKANGINVEALGTSFNVKAYAQDESVSVILIEGKVKVNDSKNEEILHPYERLDYKQSDKRFTKTELHPNANYLLWRSKELMFQGESLEEICKTLHRIYNIDFIFKTEDAKRYTYRGIIKNSSLDNVMEFISRTAPIKYRMLSDSTIVIE